MGDTVNIPRDEYNNLIRAQIALDMIAASRTYPHWAGEPRCDDSVINFLLDNYGYMPPEKELEKPDA